MAVIQVSGVALAYGARDILSDISLTVTDASRIALAGANGSGKTTLMKIICGTIKPDSGDITVQKNTKTAYLPQSGIIHSGRTLLEEADDAFADLKQKEQEVLEAADVMDSDPDAMARYSRLQHELEQTGYYSRQVTTAKVLTGLGFSPDDMGRPGETFSGGWQMRIALAKVLLSRADIILLDEPTNYLDLEARNWLESYLNTFSGGYILVSHDRYFLDQTVSEVAELFLGRCRVFRGNYTSYQDQRSQEIETLIREYHKQQEVIKKNEEFIRRFRATASKAKQVQSRVRQLEKMEPVEIPEHLKKIHITIPPPPRSGDMVAETENLSRTYGSISALDGLTVTVKRGEKIAVVGKNGAGKSTFLRIAAGRDTGYSGTFRTGKDVFPAYFAQDESDKLTSAGTILEEVSNGTGRSEGELRNLLGAFLFRGDDPFKPVNILSGGEKSRLALLKLLLTPANFLILDEPTNHLDMSSKDVLLDALKNFSGTVLFVSHDRYFIQALATRVLELEYGKPTLFEGDYSYYLWKTEGSADEEGFANGPAKKENASGKKRREQEICLKSELRKLEKESGEIFETIDRLEKETGELEHSMASPDVYEDGERVRRIKETLAEKNRVKELLINSWEEAEERREILEKQLDNLI
ncbi:MAG: ribosomal protection-like ABC-F family protein [Spirochaetia bacterium]